MKVQWGRAVKLGLVLAGLQCGGAVAATTWHAAPGASAGAACTAADPCALTTAVTKPAAGDTVQLAAGTYDEGSFVIQLTAADATITGAGDGSRPVVKAAQIALAGAGDQASDLEVDSAINGGSGIVLRGPNDLAERVIATSSGISAAAACRATADGAMFRDSLCHATGNQGFGLMAAASTGAVGVTVRNVAALSTGPNGAGLAGQTSSPAVTIDAVNTIARSPFLDVDGSALGGHVTITLANSDYATTGGLGETITAPGTNGNLEADPGFAGAFDFHLAPSSPLIDAGTEDPQDGPADLDGGPRWLGAHTDIGAYEHVSAPVAATGAASGDTITGAVNPGGLATTYHFEYGPSAAYGGATPDVAAGDGHDSVGVSAALAGLAPGTTYHYRLVATSAGGTTAGADATFTTGTAGGPPPCACPTIVPHGAVTLSRTAKVKKGVAQLKLACAGGPCSGTLALTVRAHRKTVKLGTKGFSLPAGHRVTLKLRLSRSIRRLLDRARKHRLEVTATLTPAGGRASKQTVTLSGR